MKNLSISTIFLFLFFNITLAQESEIVPFNTLPTEMPFAAYAKDVDNTLSRFIGDFVGTVGNIRLTIKTIKILKNRSGTMPDGSYYFRDRLAFLYKIENISTGEIIENTLNSTLAQSKVYSNAARNGKIYFLYLDKSKCQNAANITLTQDPAQPTKFIYRFYEDGSWWSEDCPYASKEDIPLYLPKEMIVLTKQ